MTKYRDARERLNQLSAAITEAWAKKDQKEREAAFHCMTNIALDLIGKHHAAMNEALAIAERLANPKTYEQRCVRDQILTELRDEKGG